MRVNIFTPSPRLPLSSPSSAHSAHDPYSGILPAASRSPRPRYTGEMHASYASPPAKTPSFRVSPHSFSSLLWAPPTLTHVLLLQALPENMTNVLHTYQTHLFLPHLLASTTPVHSLPARLPQRNLPLLKSCNYSYPLTCTTASNNHHVPIQPHTPRHTPTLALAPSSRPHSDPSTSHNPPLTHNRLLGAPSVLQALLVTTHCFSYNDSQHSIPSSSTPYLRNIKRLVTYSFLRIIALTQPLQAYR